MSQIVNITTASKLTGLSQYALRKGALSGRFPSTRAGGVANGKIVFDLELLTNTIDNECLSNVKLDKKGVIR